MTKLRIDAPQGWDEYDIAQALFGPSRLVKAEHVKTSANGWHAFKPMGDLQEYVVQAYEALVQRMIAALNERMGVGPLRKAADGEQVWISPEKFDELRTLIGDYHLAFIHGMLSPALLTHDEIERLQRAGILPVNSDHIFLVPSGAPRAPVRREMISDAYEYGRDLATTRPGAQSDAVRESWEAWKKRKRTKLVASEREAVKWAERKAASYVKGLGNSIESELGAIVSDAVLERRFEKVIREEVAGNIKNRKAWRTVVTALGDRTGDWARDLGRIAATEKQNAMHEGAARAMTKKRGGDPKSVRVAKLVEPNACDHCKRLYLDGGRPKLFTLAELIGNGSNVGRKASAWLATLPATHPWCQCSLVEVPDGWSFDEGGLLVPEKLTRALVLERSLIKSLTYKHSAPDDCVIVRVADPETHAIIERVIAATPPEVFTRKTGVTLITTDHDRQGVPFERADYGYWTENEIRLMQNLPHHLVERVVQHEIGHSLNVYLVQKLGSVQAVRDFHNSLWKISKEEGFVSSYAQREPIENAGEATRLYLYERRFLMLQFPRTFAFLYEGYRGLFRKD